MMTKNAEVFEKKREEINAAFPAPVKLSEYTKKRQDTYKKYEVKDPHAYSELPEETKKSVDLEIGRFGD